MKPKKSFNVNATIRGAIRRVFARSPIVQEIRNASRREVPRFTKDGSRHKKNWVERQCELCKNWVSSSKISVDHIEPVVSVDDGFVDWNTFIARLWCDKSNLQRVCDDCHTIKTQKERFDRAFKQESEMLVKIKNRELSTDDARQYMKRFSKKKLAAYPKDFIILVESLKKALKK